MDKNLLIDYMLCRTTPEQEKAVLDWLDASPENRREMDSLDETFNAMVLHTPVAAANGASREYAWQEKAGGHAGAHADGNGTKKIWKVRRLVLRYAAVAAACAALVFGGGYLYSSWKISRFAEQTLALSSPAGQTISVTLQDGTKVWLAGGSTLEYPVVFAGGERRVSVSGEAMFDVTHRDDGQPFVVSTFAGDVEVLGTKFDVLAEKETGTFSTALLLGKVRISNETEEVVLAPGQIAELRDGRLHTDEMASADDYLWIEGILSLNTPSFTKLAARLERIYDVRIMTESSEPVVKNRGKIRTADGLEHALRLILAGTGHSFEIDYETKQVHIR